MRRKRASERETPTTVTNYLIRNPLFAAFNWIFLCLFAVAILGSGDGLHWSVPSAVVAGIPLGTVVWWLVMFMHASGLMDGDA
jgi:ABC-type multidrug transport system permease subunit